MAIGRLRAAMEDAGPPPAGSRITYEPGGQLELSSLPHGGVMAAHAALAADIAHVGDRLEREGLALAGRGADARNLRDALLPARRGPLPLHARLLRRARGWR